MTSNKDHFCNELLDNIIKQKADFNSIQNPFFDQYFEHNNIQEGTDRFNRTIENIERLYNIYTLPKNVEKMKKVVLDMYKIFTAEDKQAEEEYAALKSLDPTLKKLGLSQEREPDLKKWKEFLGKLKNPTHEVNIGLVGKYNELPDAYKSIYESFVHAGAENECKVNVIAIHSESLENGKDLEKYLKDDSIIVTSDGTAHVVLHKTVRLRANQQLFSNEGTAPMGYGLPAAIGAYFGCKKSIVCIEGDGSIMMNLQELHTVIENELPIKIVILDEADFLTQPAQAALRNLIEEYSAYTRFILTCNYVERLIEPLQSRCELHMLKPPTKGAVAKHICTNILDVEGVTYDVQDVVKVINEFYPDIRSVIKVLQSNVRDSKLTVTTLDDNWTKQLIQILIKRDKNAWYQVRQLVADAQVDDFQTAYRYMFDHMTEFSYGNDAQLSVILDDFIWRSSVVPDKEINFSAAIAKILETNKKQIL